MQSAPGPKTIIDGKHYLYFGGTGYLNLQGHPEVIAAACEATAMYGISSATSRSGYGENPVLLDVERKAARFFGTEEAFYFVSGYSGNAVMTQGIGDAFDAFFVDERAHYSVHDGVVLGGKPVFSFRHCDPEDLSAQLKNHLAAGAKPLIFTDGIFPISGAIAPVDEYLGVLGNYDGAGISLDDAHAVGVLGDHGRGTYEHFGVNGENLYFSGTFSKAFGGHGGFIPAGKKTIQQIKSRCHLFDGATPPPIPAAAATAKALEIVGNSPELITGLRSNVAYFKEGLQRIGLPADDTPVPIVCIDSAPPDLLEKVQRELEKRGIIVAYVKEYGSMKGVIRIAIFSGHTTEMLDRLLEELETLL